MYPTVLVHCHTRLGQCDMGSDNPIGADNQQETTSTKVRLDARWVVGFVDGEGCFSVSIHKNPHVRQTRGWQLQAAFQVYQHERYRPVLEGFVDFFGCGRISRKGPSSSVLTYSVWALRDLDERVIPFFERNPLHVKDQDFHRFADIVGRLRRKDHFTDSGFEHIVRTAFAMNQDGKQRARTLDEILLGSSETTRQALT